MWIQAEHTGEHPQIMCSVFKETTMSLLLSPPPLHQRQHALMTQRVRAWGAGGGMRGGLPLRFSSPLLANCEILAQLLRFQVSVSSFVKQGKLFPPFGVIGDIHNSFHQENPVPLVTHVCNRPPLISGLDILLFPCLCSWAVKKQKNLLELIIENEPLSPPLDYSHDHMALRNRMAPEEGSSEREEEKQWVGRGGC